MFDMIDCGLWNLLDLAPYIYMSSGLSVFRVARVIRTLVKGNGNMENTFVKCGLYFLLGAFLSWYLGWSCLLTTLTVAAVYLVTGGWRFAKVVCNTLLRDIRYDVEHTLVKLLICWTLPIWPSCGICCVLETHWVFLLFLPKKICQFAHLFYKPVLQLALNLFV